jgi:hypothetical protein
MIIDNNFITLEQQIELTTVLSDLPWHLNLKSGRRNPNNFGALETSETRETIQFMHALRVEEEIRSTAYDYIHNNLFIKFLQKHNIVCNKVLRAKLNITTMFDEDGYETPHVDYNFPHNVFLYYINDSDGDTIMFNEKYDGTKKELTVMDKISPEMGKAIFFDGLQYHAPTSPRKNAFRAVVNIAFV